MRNRGEYPAEGKMGSTQDEGQKPPFKAKQLFVPFLLSQAIGIGVAAVMFFLELGIIRYVITSMGPEQMEKAKAMVLQGFHTQPWFVGPVLYGLLILSALTAALLCQNAYLWFSPIWREMVYMGNRPVPPRNIREAVGVRWVVLCILLPLSLIGAPVFLWWVTR